MEVIGGLLEKLGCPTKKLHNKMCRSPQKRLNDSDRFHAAINSY